MRRPFWALVASVAALLIIGRVAASGYAEWAWYDAIGGGEVYRARMAHALAWYGVAGVTVVGFAYLNLLALRRSIVSLVLPRRLGNIEIGEAVSPAVLHLAVVVLAGVIGVALIAQPVDWSVFALARYAEPFDERDFLLDTDLAYPIAWLPFEAQVFRLAARAVITVSLVVVALYAITPSLRVSRAGVEVSTYCRRHLGVLASLALLLLAWSVRLDVATLTSVRPDASPPFGVYDQRIALPMLRWITFSTAFAALAVLWTTWRGHGRIAAAIAAIACLVLPAIRASAPWLTQRSLTSVRLRDEGRSFAVTRRQYLRRAFDLDRIRIDTTPAAKSVRELAVAIPSWDPRAAGLAVAAAGTGDTLAGVSAVARAGGVGFAPVVRTDGEVWRVILGADGAGSTIELPSPLAYLGAEGVRVVADTTGAVVGARFDSRWRRMLLAWGLREPSLAFGGSAQPNRELVWHRDVRARVARLVPFLTLGSAAVPVIRDDSLYWTLELFVTARAYPLSERLIFAGAPRMSVHPAGLAWVHSATGRVTIAAAEEPDKLLRSWMRRFPTLFVSQERLPAALAALRPAPTEWLAIQAQAFGRAGVGPDGDVSRLAIAVDNADPDLSSGGRALYADSGTGTLRATAAIPMVDANGSVAGVLEQVGGREERARWRATPAGPRWADALDALQRAADSAGFGRNATRRGPALVVARDSGVLIRQSFYAVVRESGTLRLAGVAVLLDGRTSAGPTLAAAMGLAATPVEPAAYPALIRALYDRMRAALDRGDWQAFGAAFDELGRLRAIR